MNDDEILTVPQAAKLLQVGEDTLYVLVHRADFPAFRVGRRIRIHRGLLLDWAEAQAKKGELDDQP